MFRGVEVVPEKLVDFGMILDGACDATDADMEGGGLFGLSPGIRLVGRCGISDAEILWDSLLDGPCGRPIILRDAICDSEARFIGLCGADAVFSSRAGADAAGAAVFVDASALVASRLSVGAAEPPKSEEVKAKRPRFLDGGSMMSLVGAKLDA
jgi:hypothetical protein